MTDLPAEGRSHSPRPARTQLRVGRLVKAHGLKGALKIELYTDDPDGRFAVGSTFTLQVPESSPWHGKPLTVREFRWMNSHPVAFFEGVDDRAGAEELVRAILWIDEDAQSAPAEDDAWYDHQLVGLEVVRDGSVIGRVTRVDHLPSQDLLAVRPTGAADEEVLVPFVKAIVPEVDIVAGRVTVTPPAGLFEALPDDAEDIPSDGAAAEEPAADGATTGEIPASPLSSEHGDAPDASEGDDTER
ncbi:ribosome maturation factor RimM [Microbacterium sp. P06]|uniref:ribosome maturation factor RimM n=1 Tax=unclassified Microbacterium TaxID=2609290 RepID=UPI0037452E8B